MLESLGNDGMNCGMNCTLTDSIDKELQRCEHFWLSPEILSLLEALDLINRRAQNSKLTKNEHIIKSVDLATARSCLSKYNARFHLSCLSHPSSLFFYFI
jgi:hypothetical protein